MERKRNKFCEDMKNTHNFNIRIIKQNLTKEEAFDEEIKRIKEVREKFPTYRLTNRTDGGEGPSGYKLSEETKRLISEHSKAMWEDVDFKERMIKSRRDENSVYQSKEFKEKISNIVKGENNPNYGHYWTDEMKENLSKKRKANGKSKGGNNARSIKIVDEELKILFPCKKDAMEYFECSRRTIDNMIKKNKLVLFDENIHINYNVISYDKYTKKG